MELCARGCEARPACIATYASCCQSRMTPFLEVSDADLSACDDVAWQLDPEMLAADGADLHGQRLSRQSSGCTPMRVPRRIQEYTAVGLSLVHSSSLFQHPLVLEVWTTRQDTWFSFGAPPCAPGQQWVQVFVGTWTHVRHDTMSCTVLTTSRCWTWTLAMRLQHITTS